MLARLAIVATLVLFPGCAAEKRAQDARPYGASNGRRQDLASYTARPKSDLILGPNALVAVNAEAFAGRSSWPDVYLGEVVEESSLLVQIVTDDQSFADELGGWYGRLSDSVRTSFIRR